MSKSSKIKITAIDVQSVLKRFSDAEANDWKTFKMLFT